jgi:hypothetical protein
MKKGRRKIFANPPLKGWVADKKNKAVYLTIKAK